MPQLTKEQLLAGKEYTEQMEIPDLGGTVTIRPLTAREWNKISNSLLKGMEVPAGGGLDKNRLRQVKINVESVMENTFEAKTMVVSKGMVSPELTPDEVGSLKPGIIEQINKRIRQISGIDEEVSEQLDSFRAER